MYKKIISSLSHLSSCYFFLIILLITGPVMAVEQTFVNPDFRDIYGILQSPYYKGFDIQISGTCYNHNNGESLHNNHDRPYRLGHHVRPLHNNNLSFKFAESTANEYCKLLGFKKASSFQSDTLPPGTTGLTYPSAQQCINNHNSSVITIKPRPNNGSYNLQLNYYNGSGASPYWWSVRYFTHITCQADDSSWKTRTTNPKASLVYDLLQEEGREYVSGGCSYLYSHFSEEFNSDTISLGYSRTLNDIYKDRDATTSAVCRSQGYNQVLGSARSSFTPWAGYHCNNNHHLLLSVFDNEDRHVRVVKKPNYYPNTNNWQRYKIDSVICQDPSLVTKKSNTIYRSTESPVEFVRSIADLGDIDGDSEDSAYKTMAVVTNYGKVRYPPPYVQKSNISLIYLDKTLTDMHRVIIDHTSENWPVETTFDADLVSVLPLGDLDGDGPGVMTLVVGSNDSSDPNRQKAGSLYFLNINGDGDILFARKVIPNIPHEIEEYTTEHSFGSSIANLGHLISPTKTTLAIGARSYTATIPGVYTGAVFLITLDINAVMNENNSFDDNSITFTEISTRTPKGPSVYFDSRFGNSIVPLGDIDGDGPGVIGIAVSSPARGGYYDAATDQVYGIFGYLYIFNLDSSGNIIHRRILTENTPGLDLYTHKYFGTSIVFIGNFDYASSHGYLTLAVTDRNSVRILNIYNDGHVKVRHTLEYPSVRTLYIGDLGKARGADPDPGFNLDTELITLAIALRSKKEVHDPVTDRRMDIITVGIDTP